MASQNTYLAYKRDTRHLLYWMIHASNNIIQTSTSPLDVPKFAGVSTAINTTGQITVSALLPLSQLIAQRINPIPSTIYRLFQSVIDARTITHKAFLQISNQNPDIETERSNASHKRFIDALSDAFNALGGKEWALRQKATRGAEEEEDVDEVVFSNKFFGLTVSGTAGDREAETVGEEEDPDAEAAPPAPHQNQKHSQKQKKRSKKTKGKAKAAPKQSSLDDVPLESYRIIEDQDGLVTDYLMAVYSIVSQWVDLRNYVQDVWRSVAYQGLNSAAAGALSNVAIAMIKEAESAVFVEFPGHDSYDTIVQTITRGDRLKAQGMFHLDLHQLRPNSNVAEKVQETDVDVMEQFLIHSYEDLLTFITDYQKTRSGKPTKPLLAQIRDWDPKFNLSTATKEERIKWRRSYTINWLYDLINLFSSIVIQRNTMKGEKHVYENVDWSTKGPWNQHRRLYGLNEFAGDIATFAMQKPGTDIHHRILPHHVFQMQCIVDSFTVSRGWIVNSLFGHVLRAPATSRPRRDVDLFLDRENEHMGRGYCQSVDILNQILERDAKRHGNPDRHAVHCEMLVDFRIDFVNWLGETKYMSGLKTIPPSRFTSTNSNGLWEYSPFLCGVGLMEALELAYGMALLLWDRMPEPMCLIHLHNMLVRKGFIKREIGLYTSLGQLFATAFFTGGKPPTSEFHEAFVSVISEPGSRRATFERRGIRRSAARTPSDIHGLLAPDAHSFFKQRSILACLRNANWIPARIPDADIPMPSMLGMIRMQNTEKVVDPVTGNRVPKNKELIGRAKDMGLSDDDLNDDLLLALRHENLSKSQMRVEEAFSSVPIPEGYTFMPPLQRKTEGMESLDCRDFLEILKYDILGDVSGEVRPVCALNYNWVTAGFLMLFGSIEDELKRLRNPLYVRAYEQDPRLMREPRASLTALVLRGNSDDEDMLECMEAMGRIFEKHRGGFMNHIYWDNLDSMEKFLQYAKSDPSLPEVPAGSCGVM